MSTSNQSLTLHSYYLTRAQQTLCLQNPTYASQLSSLKSLKKEATELQHLIQTQERQVNGQNKPPNRLTKKRKRASAPVFLPPPTLPMLEEKTALVELEDKVRQWDDELAALAEALVAKPVVVLSVCSSSLNAANHEDVVPY